MRAVPAIALTLGYDTTQRLDAAAYARLYARGFRFRMGYLDAMTPAELEACLASGTAFVPLTYADEFDGDHTLARAAALSLPRGTTIYLDVEALSLSSDDAIARINAWAAKVVGAGFVAGLYVGAGVPLTAYELTSLSQITRYMEGCSRLLGRDGLPQVPKRGYGIKQGRPFNTVVEGVLVDVDFLCEDYDDDLPTWVVTP